MSNSGEIPEQLEATHLLFIIPPAISRVALGFDGSVPAFPRTNQLRSQTSPPSDESKGKPVIHTLEH